MVDAPLGTSNPEGSDTGPGSTVPDEQLSHGHDSANVSGHAVPAVPHGNQCAALFDAEPADNEFLHGVWTVTTFDSLELWTFGCLRISILIASWTVKGLITPILFQ